MPTITAVASVSTRGPVRAGAQLPLTTTDTVTVPNSMKRNRYSCTKALTASTGALPGMSSVEIAWPTDARAITPRNTTKRRHVKPRTDRRHASRTGEPPGGRATGVTGAPPMDDGREQCRRTVGEGS